MVGRLLTRCEKIDGAGISFLSWDISSKILLARIPTLQTLPITSVISDLRQANTGYAGLGWRRRLCRVGRGIAGRGGWGGMLQCAGAAGARSAGAEGALHPLDTTHRADSL